MIQLRDAMCHNRGVVYRHAGNPGAENDVFCHCDSFRDEEIWGGDILPSEGEMLTDVSFFVAHPV